MPAPEMALAAVLEAAIDGANDAVNDWAHAMLADLKLTISAPGRSVPYDPPGLQTGYLLRSYEVDVNNGAAITVELSTYAYYAGYLEFGTSKMAPRPHFRPAVARWLPLLGPMTAAGMVGAEKATARRYGGSG